jgi:ribonuclease HI
LAGKQKYYVVWEGNEPGIYNSWTECQLQIKGYPNAKYKSFKTLEEARAAYANNYTSAIQNTNVHSSIKPPSDLISGSISVDAACSGNPGIMEYRGVYTEDHNEIFRQGPFEDGTNNIGEFLALVHALALLEHRKDYKTKIFSDSRTAMAWVRNKKVKTTLQKTNKNQILFDLIERALNWLDTHTVQNEIYKWDTKNWGEIPADFGRK